MPFLNGTQLFFFILVSTNIVWDSFGASSTNESPKCGWRQLNDNLYYLVAGTGDHEHAQGFCRACNGSFWTLEHLDNKTLTYFKDNIQNITSFWTTNSSLGRDRRIVWDYKENKFQDIPEDRSDVHIVCKMMKGDAPPAITKFEIEIENKPPINFLSLNQDEKLTVCNSQKLTLVCESSGNPAPWVKVKSNLAVTEKNNAVKHSIDLSSFTCGSPINLSCEAGNVYANLSVSKVVNIPCKDQKPRILSFTSYYQNHSEMQSQNFTYTSSPGKALSLKCSIESGCPRANVKIFRQGESNSLFQNDTAWSTSVYHINTTCDSTGTYVCQLEHDDVQQENKKIHLGIRNCAPRLCPGTIQNQKLEADLHKNLTFSICVIANPGINEAGYLNNTQVYRGTTEDRLTWDYVLIAFAKFTIIVTVTNCTQQDNGVFTLILTSLDDQSMKLNYTWNINVQASNNKNLPAISPSITSTTLSTTSSSPDADLSSSTVIVLIAIIVMVVLLIVIALILGLIIYRLRVKLFGNFRHRHRQEGSVAHDDNEIEMDSLLYGNGINVNIVPTTVADRLYSDQHNESAENYVVLHSNQTAFIPKCMIDESSGRFISDEGLVYITLAHTGNRGKNPRGIRRSERPVEYITLDPRLSGKYNMEDKAGRKVLKMLEVKTSRDKT